MKRNNISCLLLKMLSILACFITCNAIESDINCLKSIKESFEELGQALSTWDFSNHTEGSICRFTGVTCWSDQESRVIEVSLRDERLEGPFPKGIRYCSSIQNLDLSGNYFSGSIPSNLAKDLPYIVSLDLSNNNLSGSIPPTIANFSFINTLRLDNNNLTGQIPPEFSELKRLNEFSVANNRLSGPIPTFPNHNFSADSYANNPGLCGYPMKSCKDEDDEDNLFLSGFAVGFPISTFLYALLMYCCLPRISISNTRPFVFIVKKINGMKHYLIKPISRILFAKENVTEESKITTMEKDIRILSLVDLKMATDDFNNKNVIGHGNMGLMYKGVFKNGLTFAVKRLHKFESLEKEFSSEIQILGRLSHTNLVPLFGFCFEMEKKFLVYKYMSNGNLHQWLHSRPQVDRDRIGWAIRLRIAVGIARGLAWLHHNNVLRVAHLKLNSSCILLDDKFEPKISNFGYSNILMNTSGTPSSSCNFLIQHSSPYKVDVYSFGLLLLELVSGRESRHEYCSNSSCDDVCNWELFNMIEECLMGQGFDEEIYETVAIAKDCIRSHKDEAASMLQVYKALCVVGKSRNEHFVNLCMDVENYEGDA